MRILRPLAFGSVLSLSILAIGFTCADRLAHPVPEPIPIMARLPPRAIIQTAAVVTAPPPKAPIPKAIDGFDTERLNALMRGDPAVTLARTR